MPGLASLSKSLVTKLNERKASVCLGELNDDDSFTSDYLAFQYFPETIQDTKAINYAVKDVPGGSLPIYQWTSSGERIVAFQTVFSSDVDLSLESGLFSKLSSRGQILRNVDVRSALLWLRRFMLPRYGSTSQVGTPLTLAPRKINLFIPNSGIGLLGGARTDARIIADHIICIMTQCDVTYEAFFPSGLPRIATVQLAFAQVAQTAGQVNFPRNTDQLDAVVQSGDDNLKVNQYPIRVKASFR